MSRTTNMLDHTDEEAALHWHLTANHYPPIHECFLPIAQQVIDERWLPSMTPMSGMNRFLMPNGRHDDRQGNPRWSPSGRIRRGPDSRREPTAMTDRRSFLQQVSRSDPGQHLPRFRRS